MTTYGNGDTINYRYNRLGLVDQTVRTDGDNTRTFNWAYSSVGVLLSHTDSVNNRKYNYDYDSLGRLIRQEIRTQDNSSHIGFVEQGYDLRNNINKLILSIGSTTVKQTYSYSAYSKNDADGNAIANSSASYAKDNLPTLYQIASTRYATYNYDSVNRLNKRTLSTVRPIYNNYVYWLSDRNATSSYDTVDLYRTHQLLREIVDNTAYDYTYDVLGNITSISKAQRAETNTDAIGITGSAEYRSYAYDNLNQLIRENNATNNKTTAFSYDELGNILSKTEYAYTTGNLGTVNKTILYGYSNDGKQGWNNLLTSVDLNGDGIVTTNEQITYDEIGNPITYLGNSLAWDGRQLTSYNGISYSYDADGIRASKTVGNIKTEYYYVGDVIHYQVSTNITTGEKVNELYFMYDSYGHLTSIRLITGEFTHSYYVTTNMQGDVLGIYTAGGDLITAYDYDAWGNCTATNYLPEYSLIGEINPIRYRGYYYDVETGLYYLNSRYYDSNTGRFINGDSQLNTSLGVLGCNMYAYCLNNPVRKADYDGKKPGDLFDTIDAAAIDFAMNYNALSIEFNVERSAAIYEVEATVRKKISVTRNFLWWTWTGTKTVKTTKIYYAYKVKRPGNSEETTAPQAPVGKKRVAIIHTHAAYSNEPGHSNEFFSPQDKNTAGNVGAKGVLFSYLVTPNGIVKRLDIKGDTGIVPIFYYAPYDPYHPARRRG